MASENETEKRETLADIAADLRAKARKFIGYHGVGWSEGGRLMSLADRIEVAWNQQEKTYLDQKIRDAMNMCGHEKHIAEHAQKPTVGNAAAVREACAKMRQLIMLRGDGKAYCILSWDEFNDSQKMLRAALSSPARNCDRYKDATSAYADFIVPWKLDGHLDDVPTLQDFANWLFAPAAERKGEGDGK